MYKHIPILLYVLSLVYVAAFCILLVGLSGCSGGGGSDTPQSAAGVTTVEPTTTTIPTGLPPNPGPPTGPTPPGTP